MKNIITASIIGTCCMAVSVAQESVVIEGGPTRVQISDQDGELEYNAQQQRPNQTVEGKPTAVLPQPVVPTIGLDATQTSTVRPDRGTVLTQPSTQVPAQNPLTTEPGNPALQTTTETVVTTPTTRQEIDTIRRRTELVRELNIRENANDSRIILRTKNMFESKTAEIDPVAKTLLDKIAEYLSLSPLDEVSVHYIQEPAGTTDTLALSRSMAVTKWFKMNSNVADKTFTFKTPEVRAETLDDTKPVSEGGEDFGEYIIIDLNS